MIPDIITQVVFLTGRFLHQGTARPLLGSILITAQEGPVVTTIMEDGTFALSGYLRELFPNLAAANADLHLTIRAISPQFRQGQVVLARTETIPSGSNFDPTPPTTPDPPVNAGTILLPADTISIRGRVVEARNPDTPIGGASVTVLHSGPAIPPATSDAGGWYRLNAIVITGPAQIQCARPGFGTVTRTLLLDYSKLVNDAYFRLPPP